MNFIIRILTPDDWLSWKELRLESLKLHPEVSGSAYEETLAEADDYYKRTLQDNVGFGVFIENNLIGIARFHASDGIKEKHKGSMMSVYLKKEYRGKGIADALINSVVDYAKARVEHLLCAVVAENSAALKLYEKHGFKLYGTEPRALKINDKYYDEFLMVRFFD